jgi:hypothetical protein
MTKKALLAGVMFAAGGILAASLAVYASMSDSDTPRPRNGSWSINNWVPGDSVHLTMEQRTMTSRWSWSDTQALADLKGLTREQMRSTGSTPVAFTLMRDAGTFTFEGTFKLGIGKGTFGFAPDAAYAAKLTALGYDPVTPDTQWEMALRDVSIAFAEEVRGAGLKGVVTSKDLVRFIDHGVRLEFLREIASAGFTGLSGENVIRLRDHGVDGAYLRGLKASGYPEFSADDLVQMRDHGVEPAYVGALKQSGYPILAADDLVRLHDHGVPSKLAAGAVTAGYGNVSVEELIRLHEHGIDSGYMAKVASAGFGQLSVEQIVKLHDHGVD